MNHGEHMNFFLCLITYVERFIKSLFEAMKLNGEHGSQNALTLSSPSPEFGFRMARRIFRQEDAFDYGRGSGRTKRTADSRADKTNQRHHASEWEHKYTQVIVRRYILILLYSRRYILILLYSRRYILILLYSRRYILILLFLYSKSWIKLIHVSALQCCSVEPSAKHFAIFHGFWAKTLASISPKI